MFFHTASFHLFLLFCFCPEGLRRKRVAFKRPISSAFACASLRNIFVSRGKTENAFSVIQKTPPSGDVLILQHTILFLFLHTSFRIIFNLIIQKCRRIFRRFTPGNRRTAKDWKQSTDAVFPHRKLQSGAKAGLLAQIYNFLPPSRLTPVTYGRKQNFHSKAGCCRFPLHSLLNGGVLHLCTFTHFILL